MAVPQAPEVGTYLPSAGKDGFVLFVPDARKTPALRAGTVNPRLLLQNREPYKFVLPSTWREGKVANIQSGNYCQPRCAEPWTEVVFENSNEGKVQVIVSPLVRLTNRANAKIEDIGSPEGLLNSVGPFITGTYLDEEDVVKVMKKKQEDGRTYYYYEINASYGLNGPHTVSACTTKGDLAMLYIVMANDKQWSRNAQMLRDLVDGFRA